MTDGGRVDLLTGCSEKPEVSVPLIDARTFLPRPG